MTWSAGGSFGSRTWGSSLRSWVCVAETHNRRTSPVEQEMASAMSTPAHRPSPKFDDR
jgi:hypothetical protein